MPTLDERVAVVEEGLRLGREEHQEFAAALDKLALQIAKLEVYLEQKNGGFTVSVKDKHVKFAGSLIAPLTDWDHHRPAVAGASDWGSCSGPGRRGEKRCRRLRLRTPPAGWNTD